MDQKTPFSLALSDHQITADVIDVDLYRIHGGISVETDYIIRVELKNSEAKTDDASFDPFILSKKFSQFRSFAKKLRAIADGAFGGSKHRNNITADENTTSLGRYCETVYHLIKSEPNQYIGKVNYKYVKILAKRRSHIIQEILNATIRHFPTNVEESQFAFEVAHTIEMLFLTDHCVETDSPEDEVDKHYSRVWGSQTSLKLTTAETTASTPSDIPSTPVVPLNKKKRRSLIARKKELSDLETTGENATLLLDNDRQQPKLVPSYSARATTFTFFERHPIIFTLMTLGLIVGLKRVSVINVPVDVDVLLLLMWAAFCVGLHLPRTMTNGIDTTFGPLPPSTPRKASDVHGRKLLRKMSMEMSHEEARRTPINRDAMDSDDDSDGESDIMNEIQSPLPLFPSGAALGSHMNCWSQPTCESFYVRGPNYLKDKVKIESGDFLWPVRGVDLFLTDTPPENAGRFPGIMGGQLRDLPTFIINFRLPWGVLLAYFEIPELYIPFLLAGHDPDFDKSTLPSMDNMTPSERCVSRYCQSSSEEKDTLLKIVPGVADGPWVVKSVVGNKPAILGTKMPVNYIYQKEEDGKAMYIEMDLDIVASSAARGILSMVRKYTNVLTMDLGFVVQGNTDDELPEQMLAGIRLHGLDPLTASAMPVSQEHFLSNLEAATNNNDDTESS